MNEETLKFICWLTGHDEETIKQMYNDYSSSPQAKSIPMQLPVKPDACGEWQKEKPNKPCYFIHRYNREDNKPSLFEAVMDGGVLVVASIQDDEFVETMEDFSDGDFFIIEKY